MFDDREPTCIQEGNNPLVQVHHEDITPADAGLFGTSVSFSGPEAVTWTNALSRISTLLSCNEEYGPFDQDPANLKNWKYPPPPELKSRFPESNEDSDSDSDEAPHERSHVESLAHAFFSSSTSTAEMEAARELRATESRVLCAKVRLRHPCRDDDASIIIVIKAGLNFLDMEPGEIKNPHWNDMKLCDLGPEAEDAAIREYGWPSTQSVPFRPAVDELLLDVGLDDDPEELRESPCYRFEWKGKQHFYDSRRQLESHPCRHCIGNRIVLDDASLPAIIATDEEFPCPNPPHLWAVSRPPKDARIFHRVYRPASEDLLDRFRKVTLRFSKNIWGSNLDNAIDDGRRRYNYQDVYAALGSILPRALPRLETLTIRVEPMRNYTFKTGVEYDATLNNLYDGRRIFLLDGLTAVGNTKHDPGCNGSVPCDCRLLPFDHMKRLVVKVSTKKTFGFIVGGRRPTREWFTDRPRIGSTVVCPKGVAPLTRNGWFHPRTEYPDGPGPYEGDTYFDDPRNPMWLYDMNMGNPEPVLAILNRPDSPEL